MSASSFPDFFRDATGGTKPRSPFDYQSRLAEGADTHGACVSRLIDVPTGCGKTAAVVLAWLWNRVFHPDEAHRATWPRRLVYCLPMRTLVEQTRDEVTKWLGERRWEGGDTDHAGKVGLHILMGGEERKDDWDAHPEADAILIGTQDMLLSRALNRGYGMSRYRWPMHFGLLNNDCLWVYDEVQLMSSGLATTAQLHAFRQHFGTHGSCPAWWMSATLDRAWLKTVDFSDPTVLGEPTSLSPADLQNEEVYRRYNAAKPLDRAAHPVEAPKELAKEIVKTAQAAGGLTLVVVNTVRRAVALHEAIGKALPKGVVPPLLLHSQFRPADRAKQLQGLLEAARNGQPRIAVSTQVVEAGVDLSARVLFTELAPWASLVQRFGRCNRRGDDPAARVIWIDLDVKKLAPPYEADALGRARACLQRFDNVSLERVKAVTLPAADAPTAAHVLRRKDLVELFDTAPDLSGNDIDIDRFIRDTDESGVRVFWRDWPGAEKGGHPPADAKPSAPRQEELCPVPLYGNAGLQAFLKKKNPAWRWDFLERQWVRVESERLYPGQIYLLSAPLGGYSPEVGWDGVTKPVTAVPLPARADAKPPEGDDDDDLSVANYWRSVAEHTDDVWNELDTILATIRPEEAEALREAARWHDLGKAHSAFQAKIKTNDPVVVARREEFVGHAPVAKAPDDAWRKGRLPSARTLARKNADPTAPLDLRRRHFRHELASALAVLIPGDHFPLSGRERDLAAYLIAAHHGKVRLSIRSLPDEMPAQDGGRFARGVWDRDSLPPKDSGDSPLRVELGGGVSAPPFTLSLEPMELGLCAEEPFTGLPSWSERMLALRDHFGPFRLAFLETLLRAADGRASALAEKTPPREPLTDESPRTNPTLAGAPAGGTILPPGASGAGERLLEYVDGRGAGEPPVAEGNTRPHGATRYLETSRGILAYTEVAPILAKRAAEIQLAIAAGGYADSPLDEDLVARLHRDLCAELTPDWAGRWRTVAVTVGAHEPPAPHQVAPAMRDYAADLRARWEFLGGDDEPLLLETLAFAEGRLLTIHPFHDFNGRVARLWIREVLRRAALPEVRLEAHDDDERALHYSAFHAADGRDLQPLQSLWRERFAEIV